MGKNQDPSFGGPIPSIVLWDANGKRLGYDHKHGHSIKPANFRDMHVLTHGTNEKPEYVLVAAQRHDPVRVAAIGFGYANGAGKGDTLLGDTPANCGGPWQWSTNRIADDPRPPVCSWLWSSHKKDDDKPDGWSWHIPSFIGSEARVKQCTDHPETMCNHTARFQLHNSLWNDHYRISIFDSRPLRLNGNLTDPDVEKFMNEPIIWSDPVNHDIVDAHKKRDTISK